MIEMAGNRYKDLATDADPTFATFFGDAPIDWFSVERLVLVNARDPRDKMTALFNPESLDLGITATVGKINTIGSSHAFQQYAHSETDDFSVPMVLDHFAMIMRYGSYRAYDINEQIDWLTSFTLPRGGGVAPPLLVLSWGGTMTMLVCVKHVTTTYKSWFANGQPRACVVSLDCAEMRRRDRTSNSHRTNGWRIPEPGVSIGGAVYGNPLGAPGKGMKFGR